MKKKFRRKKNIKWIMPFGRIFMKNKRYNLETVAIEHQTSSN
jgi:hypothetical protein